VFPEEAKQNGPTVQFGSSGRGQGSSVPRRSGSRRYWAFASLAEGGSVVELWVHLDPG
jgi:hypothetical protein